MREPGKGSRRPTRFSPATTLIAENGALLNENNSFKNDIYKRDRRKACRPRPPAPDDLPQQDDDGYQVITFDTELTPVKLSRTVSMHPFVPENAALLEERSEAILSIQSKGLKKG
jgi:hypothetical protein